VNGGRVHVWQELPWEWVAEQWLSCTRVYSEGYAEVLYAVQRLEPRGEGTRLYAYWGAIPRGWFGSVALGFGMRGIERAHRTHLPGIAARLAARAAQPIPPPPAVTLPEAAEARLSARRTELLAKGLPARCVDPLVAWIREGDVLDLHRIQVRERARRWAVPEAELLRTALHATRAGLLTLSWDTVCPHCRGVRDAYDDLGALKATARCEVCDVDFTTDGPEAVEVTFRVHPSVRDVPEVAYCSAEPARKDHVRVQRTLPPGATVALRPTLAAGRYRLRAGAGRVSFLDATAEGDGALRWTPSTGTQTLRHRVGGEVQLVNDLPAPQTFTLEQAQWSDLALRPGQLLGTPEFRDLFSEAYLGADVRLAVGEQTVLFTDVVGSTAFYAARGDPAAFVEIKRHFDEVFAAVRARRGAVVKTIGDAVMATFGDPVDALRAAADIHRAFPPGRADSPIRVRVSLNTGSCIAVRLNANIDYFGGTVNVAAKVQSLAGAGQVAVCEATYRAPGVAAFLAGEGAALEPLYFESAALPAPLPVWRWTVTD
jgi:class 3 adenylate cyclase